jgi:DnaK suppressor protein
MPPASDQENYRAALLKLQEHVHSELTTLAPWCEPVAPDVALGRLTRSDAMQDQQMALHQRERLQAQQTRILTALERIDAGTFGFCLACKQPIDARRLETAPDSPLCVPCLEKRKPTH